MPFDSTLNTPRQEPTQAEIFAARLEKLADIAEKDNCVQFSMHSWSTCLAGIACRSGEFGDFRSNYNGVPTYRGHEGGAACKAFFGDHTLFAAVDKPDGENKAFYVERLRVHARALRGSGNPQAPRSLREFVMAHL